jgi:predicted flap endonuclease-1-like 5' DNA nuclease
MTQENISGASPSLSRLVQELNRLPGIGPKSAQRLAYYIIRLPDEEAYALADAVTSVKQNIVFLRGVPESDRRLAVPGLLRPSPRPHHHLRG